jgi:hypothetical protein
MGPCPAENVLNELIALEHQGWQSLCDGTAGQFCLDLLADDALLEFGDEVVMDRVAVAQTLARGSRLAGYDIAGAHLVSVGARAAALEYIGFGYPESGGSTFVGTVRSLYRRTGTGWKLVLCRQLSDDD